MLTTQSESQQTIRFKGRVFQHYREGGGIISYGTLKGGQPQVSISKVVLKDGKHTGYGEYYSRTGRNSKRSYENGKSTESVPFYHPSGSAADKEIASDMEAYRYQDGLVN